MRLLESIDHYADLREYTWDQLALSVVQCFISSAARKAWASKGRVALCWGLSIWAGMSALPALAQPLKSVTLGWDAVSDAASYRLYYGGVSGHYTNSASAGPLTQVTVPYLRAGATYYFAVTAYNAEGVESPYSVEMSYTLPFPVELRLDLGGATSPVLSGTGQPGHVYDILATRRFTAWQAIGTVTAGNDGSFLYPLPVNKTVPCRFFRLHDVTGTPSGSPPGVSAKRLDDQQLLLQLTGEAGHAYDVEMSINGGPWQAIGAVLISSGGSGSFLTSADSGNKFRFFRARDTTYGASNWPARLSLSLAAARQAVLGGVGTVGCSYELLVTENLSTWSPLGMLSIPASGNFQWSDPQPAFSGARFYRLRQADP